MKLGWKNFFFFFKTFPYIWNDSPNISQLTHIFQRDWNHQPGLQYPSSGFLVAQLTPDVCSCTRFFLCWWYARQKFCAAILSEIEIPTLLILQSFLWLLTQISSCLWCHVNITQFFQSTTQYYYPFFPVGFLDLDGFIEVIGQSLSKHHWPILE